MRDTGTTTTTEIETLMSDQVQWRQHSHLAFRNEDNKKVSKYSPRTVSQTTLETAFTPLNNISETTLKKSKKHNSNNPWNSPQTDLGTAPKMNPETAFTHLIVPPNTS